MNLTVNMAITMQEALMAKTTLRGALRSAGVQAACGVTKTGTDYAVKVNVASKEIADKVPRHVLDVPVVIAITGPVRAMAARKER